MEHQQLTRRRFVVSVIALSAAAGSALRPDLFTVSRAWAESASSLDDSLRETMLRMARLLFPHDALSDDAYAGVLDMALSNTASSDEFAAQLNAMHSIEAEPFFVAIREHVRLGAPVWLCKTVGGTTMRWSGVQVPGLPTIEPGRRDVPCSVFGAAHDDARHVQAYRGRRSRRPRTPILWHQPTTFAPA